MRARPTIRAGLGAAVCALALSIAIPAVPSAGAPAKGKTKAERKRERLKKMRKANRRQKRPNVVVIETDDQTNSLIGMSSVQGLLAARGTTFANSFANYPLCCPSRATFLTGQYAHNSGVVSTDLIAGYGALDELNTLAVWLRRSGYRTAMVGKYLNGYGIDDGFPEPVPDKRQVPPGWAEFYGLTAGTDQRRYNYRLNENGKVRKYGRRTRDYVTDVLASKAVQFVKRRAPRAKPLFLWFTPTAPHGEQYRPPGATRDPTPALRHLGRFEGAKVPRTANFNEDDVSDKPAYIADSGLLPADVVADLDLRYRSQLESLLAVDQAVRRLVRQIRKRGDKKKTVFIFTSDNGLQMGAHRLLFKAHLYDESTRVPLIIRGPGFPAGAVREQLVSNVDLAPTILQLARARPTLALDGRSLIPFARNPGHLPARDLLLESQQTGAVALRTGRWQYTEYGSGERELYDMATDPQQLESLHDSPAHATIRAQLATRLQQIRGCAGGSCP